LFLNKLGDIKALIACLQEWPVFDYWYNEIRKYEFFKLWKETAQIPEYEPELEALKDIDKQQLGMRYFNVGELLLQMGHHKKGIPIAKKAVEILEKINYGTLPNLVML